MRICLPVETNKGLESPLCSHFGSAPLLLVVDTETQSCKALARGDTHEHGRCMPVASLAGENVEAVVVGGIGRRALDKLGGAGIRVYRVQGGSVLQALEALEVGELSVVDPSDACAEHHHHH